MSDYFLLLALVGVGCLLILSCFFSSSETSVLAVNRHKLRSELRSNNGRAARGSRLLNRLLMHQERLLANILLGNNLSNILLSSLVTLITIRLWGESAIVISSILLTLVVLIFAEITPKNYALRNADFLARLFAYPLTVVDWLLKPVSVLIVKFADLIIARDQQQSARQYNIEDVRSVISDPGTVLSSRHRDVIMSILDLEGLTASDALVPKKEIVGLDISDLAAFNVSELNRVEYSRLVVYDRDMDKVEGFIRMRALLALQQTNSLTSENVRKHMEKLIFVPETIPLLTLFSQLRSQNANSCFVVDEYGAFQGLITVSDLLDEVLGDINANQLISKQKNTNGLPTYLISGKANVRVVNKRLGWNLPQWQGVTLHGLIIEQLESLPQGNICLRINNYLVQTAGINKGFVTQARVSLLPDVEEDL